MKAAPDQQRALLELVRLDRTLNQLEHRRRTLPEQIALDDLQAEMATARSAAARTGIDIEDIDRAIAKLESDIAAVRMRQERDQALAAGGTLPAKQITEIEHELGTLGRRQEVLETEELELMERREALAADLARTGAITDDLTRRIGETTITRDGALADIEGSSTAAARERENVVGGIATPLLDLYTEIRASTGVGAGVYDGGRCGACAMSLDRGTVAQIRTVASDEVIRCPECTAILIRSAS